MDATCNIEIKVGRGKRCKGLLLSGLMDEYTVIFTCTQWKNGVFFE